MSAEPSIGHNSAIRKEDAAKLAAFIDRVERLEEEKKGISDDIKDVKAEAEAAGFSKKAFGAVLKLRKREAAEVVEETMTIETYCRALGMASYLE